LDCRSRCSWSHDRDSIFAQKLRWVPAGGFVPFWRDPVQHLVLLLMPAGTIAIGLGARSCSA